VSNGRREGRWRVVENGRQSRAKAWAGRRVGVNEQSGGRNGVDMGGSGEDQAE